MPAVDAGNVTMTVTFAKAKSFTILYRAEPSAEAVWCKFVKTENNEDTAFAVQMDSDAAMDGVTVWSVKVMAAFTPSKVNVCLDKGSA